jgi:hypothetical protein
VSVSQAKLAAEKTVDLHALARLAKQVMNRSGLHIIPLA